MRVCISVPAIVLVFLALGASACSSDKGPQYHDAALEESVRSYGKALSAPDAPAAWRLMSKRCQSMSSLEMVTSVAKVTHDHWGAESVTTFHIDRLAGTRATVTYGYGKGEEDKGTGWVREGGVWKYDCSKS